MSRIIFITGTDTGVGKTAITALLLAHLLQRKTKARALKPFSTGGEGDQALLAAVQEPAFPISFFHYPEPISPWAAARLHQARVTLSDAVERIRPHALECDLLLVEGAGGLLSPLGEAFSAAELIAALSAETIVVAPDRLGVLNHTLLTIEALRRRSVQKIKVALVEQGAADVSRKTNLDNLRELLGGIPVFPVPYLMNYLADSEYIRGAAPRLREILADLLK